MPCPEISIIMPVRNEERHIEAALRSVLAADLIPADVEILVVDGRSSDRTRDRVEEIRRAYPDHSIQLLDNPAGTTPHALNIALRAARGSLVIRLDAHSTYLPGYLERIRAEWAVAGPNIGNIGGVCENRPANDSAQARAIARILSSPFGVGNSQFRVGSTRTFADTVPFGSFRRPLFDQVGFFDERLLRNQDLEMNHRIRQAGLKILLEPEIRCQYAARPTLASFLEQNFHNGLWNILTLTVNATVLRPRHLAPLAFVAGLTLALAASLFGFPWLLAALGILYLPPLMWFSIKAARQADEWPWILLGIPALHIGYGCGSLAGLCRLQAFCNHGGVA
jgi:glycosyltransferase involved in cell wall biosynthesis